MTKTWTIRSLSALLLPLALLLLPATNTAAADVYEAGWNGGHLPATANADFTEATIESISTSFDGCGTSTGETSCTWEAILTLHSGDNRCNPATPEEQVLWDSGLRTGNGSVSDGPKTFPLEGCRGQSLTMRLEHHKTLMAADRSQAAAGPRSGGSSPSATTRSKKPNGGSSKRARRQPFRHPRRRASSPWARTVAR